MQTNIIEQLQEYGVQRRAYIRAKNRILLQAMALTRRAIGWNPNDEEKSRAAINKRAATVVDALMAGKDAPEKDADVAERIAPQLGIFRAMMIPAIKAISEVEKAMVGLAKKLPAIGFVQSVAGLGIKAFAIVISETGDLAKYPKKGHLWKRIGLAPFASAGEVKACSSWRKSGGLSAEEWIAAGYRPQRLAEIYACVAIPMAQGKQLEAAKKSGTEYGRPLGPYGEIYVRRRELTAQRYPEWTRAHARADALRIMSKRVIRDLWRAWRDEVKTAHRLPETATQQVPTPQPSETEADRQLPKMATPSLPRSRPSEPEAVRRVPEMAIDCMPTAQPNEQLATHALPAMAKPSVPTARPKRRKAA